MYTSSMNFVTSYTVGRDELSTCVLTEDDGPFSCKRMYKLFLLLCSLSSA